MSSESAATGSRRTVRIGKYEVVAHVATGGMGAVYRALDTEENREVALKVLTPEMAAKPAMLERFRREAHHAAKLCHENIVAVYEFNEINGTYYIAMEFVEGIDLHDYIDQKGTLDPEESRQIIIQAARALAHAHTFGIVHRDIKPSNFLLTRKNNKLVIKLTDLGLAREAQSEAYRVTRAGTTVGTVDYISPEQARDSGSADIRSDLYSLGCTWFHMLAGHPPFPDGGLAERLYKHMEAEPPDVREFNPRVSRQLYVVLGKLLAKKPADRYQDPTELLQALNEMTAIAKAPHKRETVADVDLVASPDTEAAVDNLPVHRKEKEAGGTKKKHGPAHDLDRASVRRAAAFRKRLFYIGIAVGSLLVLVGVALVLFLPRHKQPTTNSSVRDPNDPGPFVKPDPVPIIKPDPVPGTTIMVFGLPIRVPVVKPDPDPVPGRFKPLYQPSKPFNVKQLRAEVEKPWSARTALPENVPVLRVSRVPDGKGENVFTSIEEAVQKAPADGPFVIEIYDNGPLYEKGCDFGGRQVVLRAGKGYRPLLVWDHARDKSAERAPIFLKVGKGGSLTLENLDVAVKVPETSARWTLLHAIESDLTATSCTFSQTGKSAEAVVLARFEGKLCRFTRCYARGNQLVALELNAPEAEVLFDGCLLVGGDSALLQIRADKDKPATVRIVQSTLIASQTLLRLEGNAGKDEAALNWFGWDALLSRAHKEFGGQLVVLNEGIGSKNVHWLAINCLYAGWGTLLNGPPAVESARGIQEWQSLWGRTEGDDVRSERWPPWSNLDAETRRPEEFRPGEKTEVGVAATLCKEKAGDLPIGCDIDALPPVRKNWLRLLPDRFPAPPVAALPDNGPPEIPRAEAPLYAGEKLDLATLNPPDLGLFLQDRLKQKFAEKVVLHLHNANKDVKFTPFTVPANSSLTIYYQMKAGKPEEQQPLNLEVVGSSADAVLATEQGALELTNLEFRLPDVTTTKLPPVLLKVHGDLRLHRCRLITSEKRTPSDFKALIDFHGSGEESPDKPAHTLVLNQTILLSNTSAPTCVRVFDSGARLLFQQTLIVAAGDGVAFQFAPEFKGRANVQCWFQNCTLAARRSAIVLNGTRSTDVPIEPIMMRSKDCAFVNPFVGSPKAGLLRSQSGALARGLLLWQSDGDALDKRLFYVAASTAAETPQAQSQWEKLWGSLSVQRLATNAAWPKQTLDADRWGMSLDRLETPPFKTPGQKDHLVGVKLADLGIKKKP